MINVPPEKIAQFKVPTVCLEHGKAEPRPAIPYEIKPIESVTDKPEVQELCRMLGTGQINQRGGPGRGLEPQQRPELAAVGREAVAVCQRRERALFHSPRDSRRNAVGLHGRQVGRAAETATTAFRLRGVEQLVIPCRGITSCSSPGRRERLLLLLFPLLGSRP